jgi:hypothetical protein
MGVSVKPRRDGEALCPPAAAIVRDTAANRARRVSGAATSPRAAGDRHGGAPRAGARDCFSGASGHGGGQIRLGCCYFSVFYSQAGMECPPKVRQGYKGHVLERRTDVQEKKQAAYFQPGVQAFGD